ncbi:MAG: 4Fe-4S ferredoxin, partial [Planctomycetes bacterium]|nr:4Fe-4S ferredoxin [Planctomycetota bacterium]
DKNGAGQKRALWMADRMGGVTAMLGVALTAVGLIHSLLGTRVMTCLASAVRTLSGNRIPLWNPHMPWGAKAIDVTQGKETGSDRKVVYFPSCINRSMGVSRPHRHEKQLSQILVGLLNRGGFEVIYPKNLNALCCGMAFSSKGYTDAGSKKSNALQAALVEASQQGRYPILCDMSPCLFTMKENMEPTLKLYEPAEFISEYLLPFLDITQLQETIAVFPVCSMKKMGLQDTLRTLAETCAARVVVPDTNCCGFAGDRGFSFPELNAHGLRQLREQLPKDVTKGYSTSRTCEIGLSLHSGISFQSIVTLVDQVSRAKKS